MEVLDVEPDSQLCLSPGPQLPDLELANLVASGLTRPGHIPVNLKQIMIWTSIMFFLVDTKIIFKPLWLR